MHIFFPEMSIYKRYSDKTKCMYFMIKDKTIFDKYVDSDQVAALSLGLVTEGCENWELHLVTVL